jgi:hypothetical protein
VNFKYGSSWGGWDSSEPIGVYGVCLRRILGGVGGSFVVTPNVR